MCDFSENSIIDFAVRAIAAGAGGQKLAVWALEERTRLAEQQRQDQFAQDALWRTIQGDRT